MSEITIAEPLSGEEVLDAICEKIRTMLQRDCYMNPASAYESFSADIAVKVRLKDCGRICEVPADVHVQSETAVDDDSEFLEAAERMEDAPPNQVRQEAGLPIPTLVEDSQGKRDVKRVKYAKKPAPAESLVK